VVAVDQELRMDVKAMAVAEQIAVTG